MRGRTNITGGGMSLNATTKEFMVANGKSVVAGDFVEYFKTVSERTLASSSFSTRKHTQISDDLCLCLNSNILCLLKQSEDGLVIIDAYSNHVVQDYAVLSDGSIGLCVGGAPYVVRIKVVGESFQYVCQATGIPEDGILTGDALAEYNGKLYMFCHKVTSGSAYIVVCSFDISDSSSVSYEKTVDNFYPRQVLSILIAESVFVGSHCYIQLRATYSSRTDYRISEYEFNDGELSSEKEIASSANNIAEQPLLLFYDKYILYTELSTIYVYNTSSGEKVPNGVTKFGFERNSSISSYDKILLSRIDGGKMAVFYNGNMPQSKDEGQNGIFNIEKSTGDMILVSNIFALEREGYFAGAIYLNGMINDIIYSNLAISHALTYDEYAGLITEMESKSYVEPYKGGLSIGVAKQSGMAGQSIEVYVAKSSA